jgi:hypothetical protein
VFELAEEALDEIALAVEALGKARLPFAVGITGDYGDSLLNHRI